MKTEIDKAIKLLSEKIDRNVEANDALKFTQAALNLAHTLAVLKDTDNQK